MGVKNLIRSTSYIVISTVLLIGYNNCGKSNKEDPQSSSEAFQQLSPDTCENQLMMFFDRSYHPFLRENCASCHATGPGKGQFANADTIVAYKDFMQIGYSKVSSNAISDGHNPPYSGSHHTQKVNELRISWVQALAENDICKGGTGSVEDTLSVQDRSHFSLVRKNIPAMNDNEEKRLEFNLATELSAIKGDPLPILTNAKFSIMVRKEVKGKEKYYAVHSPRIFNGVEDIHVKGLFTKINGRYVLHSTNFRYVDKSIPKNSLETTTQSLVSTGALIIPGTMFPEDEISFDFEKIEPTIIPPPPPPVAISFTSSAFVLADNSGVVNVQIALDKPSTEPISFTVEADATPLCGAAGESVTLNNSTCLPAAYNLLCPGGGCGTNITTVSKARSVVGTTYNRFDWDYKFNQTSALFSIGESTKTLQVITSKDIRHEANRILTLKLSVGIGNATVGTAQVHILFNKRKNPVPGPTDITFSKLMNSTNGILLFKCGNCHNSNPGEQQGGFDIANYELMVTQGVLKPGQDYMTINPTTGDVTKTYASKLFKRMNPQDPESGSYLTPMPRDKYLDYDTEISYVERWILNGALNN